MTHAPTETRRSILLPRGAAARYASGAVAAVAAIGRAARLVFVVWPRRWRQRVDLLDLPPDRLADLGLDRVDVLREGWRPFWRGRSR